MNSIINQLWGVSFYLHALIPCISILFENKTEGGVKSLEHFLCMGCLIFFPSMLSVVFPGLQAQQKHATCCWTLVDCSVDALPLWFPIQKKKSPINRIHTHTHTHETASVLRDKTYKWRQVEYSANRLTSNRRSLSQTQPRQKSWTSEPCRSKLKVWLLVEIGLAEVTSGKCLCLPHFTANSHLTSDFLTGSTAFILVYLPLS